MTSSHGDGTQAHYDRLAASYDQNWAYSPAYIAWMTACILDRAAIGPGQVVADIGCGTGLYSRQLAAAGATVICADPSQAMLDQLPGDVRDEVRQVVEPVLGRAPVEAVRPLLHQGTEVGRIGARRPRGRVGRRGVTRTAEAVAEVGEDVVGHLDAEWRNGHRF